MTPRDTGQNAESESCASVVGPVDRRFSVGRIALVAASISSVFGATAMAIAKDNEDDDDNSGHGSGDDHDDDDHSGSGHGGDDDDHDDRDDDDDDDDHGGDPRSQPVSVGVTEVEILDEIFVPNHIQIETGQTVTWFNHDDDDHTASGRGMDTGIMVPGASGQVRFLEPGEFDYTCNFHPEMRGLVVVTGNSLATPEASPVSLPTAAEIDIVDFSFDSDDVVVGVGAVVTWTNTGATSHTVTGDFADSGVLDAGDTFEFTFEEAGTFDYFCAIHPGMTGVIDVREQQEASPVAGSATEATVDIVNFAFEPAGIRVARGGSVTWTNVSETPHTIRGDFGDSDIMDPGAENTFAFDEAGEFEYICALHPAMIGTVIVE